MNSLKSTCVVLILAGVLYGVYVTLNAPAPSSHNHAHHAAEIQPPAIDFGPASQAPSLSPPTAQGTTGQLPLVTEPAVSLPTADASPTANVPATFTAPDLTAAPPAVSPPVSPPANEPVVQAPPLVETAPTAPPPTSNYELPSVSPPVADQSSPQREAYKLKNAWSAVEQHVKDGKLRDALKELSPFANNPQLTPEDRRAVHNWLDALAARVIYGPEHFLSEPHRVTRRDQSLYDVAAAYKVPAQLLQNINSQSVSDPAVLVPNTELKIVPGPFRAELSLTAGELTLFVGPLYAGRFAFTVGDERPAEGTYQVVQKDGAHAYIGRDGRQIPAGDSSNPYGNCWIDLGRGACLHGSPAAGQGPALGCISFSPQDAYDLYCILSVQSEIVIKP